MSQKTATDSDSRTHLNIRLKSKLRRNLLQGEPWVYRDHIEATPSSTAQLARLYDSTKHFLAWGWYDPHSVIALRILSFENRFDFFPWLSRKLSQAALLRMQLGYRHGSANCYRLVNGEADFLPGLIIDIYKSVAVLQCDGRGAAEFWPIEWLATYLMEHLRVTTVHLKPRRDQSYNAQSFGSPNVECPIWVTDRAGISIWVDWQAGQKTGFFLDQSTHREHIRHISSGLEVLNLFSYSGGFSVAAGLGAAKAVRSVDRDPHALKLAHQNWLDNGLAAVHHSATQLDLLANKSWDLTPADLVICDPPTLRQPATNSPKTVGMERIYRNLLTESLRLTRADGFLSFSSCTAQFDAQHFERLIFDTLKELKVKTQVIAVGTQSSDHPWLHALPQSRYLKWMILHKLSS